MTATVTVDGSPRRSNAGWVGRGSLWFLVIATTIVSLFPIAVMVVTGLKPDRELTGAQRWLPREWTFEHVRAVFTSDELRRWLSNSAIIACGTLAVVMVCAIPAAFALARTEFAGRRLFLDIILITQMVSPAVLVVPLYSLLTSYHLVGSYFGVIVASAAFVLPFSTWLLVGFFRKLPVSLEEAAALDGCSRLRFLFEFALPNSIPGLVATGVYVFLFGWNEFVFSLTFLSGDNGRWPITVGVFSNSGQWFVEWQGLMLTALIGTIPVLVLFVALGRHLEEGLGSTLD